MEVECVVFVDCLLTYKWINIRHQNIQSNRFVSDVSESDPHLEIVEELNFLREFLTLLQG